MLSFSAYGDHQLIVNDLLHPRLLIAEVFVTGYGQYSIRRNPDRSRANSKGNHFSQKMDEPLFKTGNKTYIL